MPIWHHAQDVWSERGCFCYLCLCNGTWCKETFLPQMIQHFKALLLSLLHECTSWFGNGKLLSFRVLHAVRIWTLNVHGSVVHCCWKSVHTPLWQTYKVFGPWVGALSQAVNMVTCSSHWGKPLVGLHCVCVCVCVRLLPCFLVTTYF